MARPVRPVLLVALVLVLAALSSCGGETAKGEDYIGQVNQVQMDFAATVQKLSSSITGGSSSTDDRRTLQRFSTAIDDVVGDLRRIDAPREVVPEHRRLVAAMQGYGTEVDQATRVVSDPSKQRLAAAQRRLAQATTTVSAKINTAIDAINSKLGS